jgi:hypothetical protein
MEGYQVRVVEEKKDLDGKIERLRAFMWGPDFLKLPPEEQRRLRRQEMIMELYSDVLDERIGAFLAQDGDDEHDC